MGLALSRLLLGVTRPIRCNLCNRDCTGHGVIMRLFPCQLNLICENCDRNIHGADRSQACPICLYPGSVAENEQIPTASLETSNATRENIVLVMGRTWDNIMDPASTVGQQLAACIARLRLVNVFCIVERVDRRDTLKALEMGVILRECNRDSLDDNIAEIQEHIREVHTLIGFMPNTQYLIDAIIEAIHVERPILIHTETIEEPAEHQFYYFVNWSLGSVIGRSVEDNAGYSNHNILVPSLADDIRVNIPERRTPGFHFIFPLVLTQTSRQYLKQHAFDTALLAIRQYVVKRDVEPIVTVLLDATLMNNSRDIYNFSKKCGISELRIRFPLSSTEWIYEIQQACLALCASPQSPFDHWIFKLIQINVPFLVSASSGMGQILSQTHPFGVVQSVAGLFFDETSNVENWCHAIENIFENLDDTLIDFCHGHGEFNRRHMEGFIPLIAHIFPMYDLTFRQHGNEAEIEDITREMRRRFHHLTVITRMDLLEISKTSVKMKCESTDPITRADLDVEKHMVKLYRDFQTLGQTILRVDHGSLVFKVLSHSKEDAKKLEDMNADGSLLTMMRKYCVTQQLEKHAAFTLILKRTCTYRQPTFTPVSADTRPAKPVQRTFKSSKGAGSNIGSSKPIFDETLDLDDIYTRHKEKHQKLLGGPRRKPLFDYLTGIDIFQGWSIWYIPSEDALAVGGYVVVGTTTGEKIIVTAMAIIRPNTKEPEVYILPDKHLDGRSVLQVDYSFRKINVHISPHDVYGPRIISGASLGDHRHVVLTDCGHYLYIVSLNKEHMIVVYEQKLYLWDTFLFEFGSTDFCLMEQVDSRKYRLSIYNNNIKIEFKMGKTAVQLHETGSESGKLDEIKHRSLEKLHGDVETVKKIEIGDMSVRKIEICDIDIEVGSGYNAPKPVCILPGTGDIFIIDTNFTVHNYNSEGIHLGKIFQKDDNVIPDLISKQRVGLATLQHYSHSAKHVDEKGDGLLSESFTKPRFLLPHPQAGLVMTDQNGIIMRYRNNSWVLLHKLDTVEDGVVMGVCIDLAGNLYALMFSNTLKAVKLSWA